ncbi:kinase-like domain-containing protein [Catenaria anguillulae PL171]|uniref:non-specific serine/threonine protein kinase n=1 Tax=Catenaria anguillulae PL171 TaxID=765915 RepID=A0A1Y2H5G4_9FUNG|nr:kinase-like domain-containing protein [Catenaria anguillulae PL171]
MAHLYSDTQTDPQQLEQSGSGSQLLPDSSIPFQGTLHGAMVRGFALKETIGEGTYGKVKIAVNPMTMERIAVKIMGKETLQLADDGKHYVPVSTIKRMKKELDIHKALNHHNVIRLYDHYEDSRFVFLMMELAAGGELFDKIVPDVGLDEELSHFYFRQLVNAAVYLHSRGVAHRDLKPENMLLDEQGNLKLSDFGLATVYKYKNKRRVLTTPCGSPPYLAPEVAQCKYDGELADVWSMGVILYVLLNGCSLWDEPTTNSPEFIQFVAAHYNNDCQLQGAWQTMDPEARRLILGMLHLPPLRMRLAKVATDPWTTQANRLYGDDGRCCDVPLLMDKLKARLESAGEDLDSAGVVANAPYFVSFSQPDDISLGTHVHPSSAATGDATSLGAHDPIAWFSQPVVATHIVGSMSQQHHPHSQQVPASQQFHVGGTATTAAGALGSEFSPSTRLTRFFTQQPPPVLHAALANSLHRFVTKCSTLQVDEDSTCHLAFTTVDSRRCRLSGDIRIQAVGPTRDIWLVLFMRRKGDPLEFKKFFKCIMSDPEVARLVVTGGGGAAAAHGGDGVGWSQQQQ